MEKPKKQQQQTLMASMFKRTTGPGTRPAPRPHQEMKEILASPSKVAEEFPALSTHDDNQRRLTSAIHDAHQKYQAEANRHAPRFPMLAGHVNEAALYDAQLRKYAKMTPQEKSDRVYLPQMSIFRDDDRGGPGQQGKYRIPDLLKLKRTSKPDEEPHYKASFVEFKSNEHTPEQRGHVMNLLSEPQSLRAAESSNGPPHSLPEHQIFHFEDVPVTRFKTVFTGDAPNMDEPHPNKLEQQEKKRVLKGTSTVVSVKRARKER